MQFASIFLATVMTALGTLSAVDAQGDVLHTVTRSSAEKTKIAHNLQTGASEDIAAPKDQLEPQGPQGLSVRGFRNEVESKVQVDSDGCPLPNVSSGTLNGG